MECTYEFLLEHYKDNLALMFLYGLIFDACTYIGLRVVSVLGMQECDSALWCLSTTGVNIISLG